MTLCDCPNIDKNDRPTPTFPHHLSVLTITTILPRHSSGTSISDNVRPWKDHFYIIENSDRPFSTGSPVRGGGEGGGHGTS